MSLVMRAFGAFHAGVYRLSKGKIGGKVGQMPILLLTAAGRKSGQPRTCPLGYVADGERLLLVASALGASQHPAWYHNLRADPLVTIRRGDADERMLATTAAGEERARLWARLVADYPFFAEHQRKTTREIPIVILTAAA